ncbi:hypothetical protein [Streptomyces adelaidensis]|uniref:hypothetical protein n=1 Tax=Streptomyces adelaidensis TaxID=2796465 RepID=UPI00190675BE|nr:hypothetical protein [Streptomyces adelaidensis]
MLGLVVVWREWAAGAAGAAGVAAVPPGCVGGPGAAAAAAVRLGPVVARWTSAPSGDGVLVEPEPEPALVVLGGVLLGLIDARWMPTAG